MRYCVLCNDVMVLLKEESKGKLSFKNEIPLAASTLRDCLSEVAAGHAGVANAFEVVSPKKTFVLIASSTDVKHRWFTAISKAIWRLTPPGT